MKPQDLDKLSDRASKLVCDTEIRFSKFEYMRLDLKRLEKVEEELMFIRKTLHTETHKTGFAALWDGLDDIYQDAINTGANVIRVTTKYSLKIVGGTVKVTGIIGGLMLKSAIGDAIDIDLDIGGGEFVVGEALGGFLSDAVEQGFSDPFSDSCLKASDAIEIIARSRGVSAKKSFRILVSNFEGNINTLIQQVQHLKDFCDIATKNQPSPYPDSAIYPHNIKNRLESAKKVVEEGIPFLSVLSVKKMTTAANKKRKEIRELQKTISKLSTLVRVYSDHALKTPLKSQDLQALIPYLLISHRSIGLAPDGSIVVSSKSTKKRAIKLVCKDYVLVLENAKALALKMDKQREFIDKLIVISPALKYILVMGIAFISIVFIANLL